MNHVTIAFAPVNKPNFSYICAEFPVADRALLNCFQDPEETNKLMSAARLFMGLPAEMPCVSSLYYPAPKRHNYTFEDFIFDLENQYRAARANVRANRQRSVPVFAVPSVD